MKIKNLLIQLSFQEWKLIKRDIIKEYGLSILISWRMRQELGCVCRIVWQNSGDGDQVFLDFWDEADMTMFAMRWA